jgi:ribosomal protein S18 acetylase RimI-like enzyme
MAGYRFCRSDDIPLLVEAYNRCYAAYIEGASEMTVEEFKRDVRDLDLWSSSCMLALNGADPVGVVLACKRKRETLIHCIGVQPDHRRQGHGHHLLDSLSRKLAILGPPRLVAEVPQDDAAARAFFEACDYRREGVFADFRLELSSAEPATLALTVPITLDELLESAGWNAELLRSWPRTLETLTNRKEQMEGVAVASDERIEAWVLHRRGATGECEIAALGSADDERARAVLGILIRHVGERNGGSVSIPRISPAEVDFAVLESWGFENIREYVGYAATAGPDAPVDDPLAHSREGH